MPESTKCACGSPLANYCHECHKPVCINHACGFLVSHCRECWERTHGKLPAPAKGNDK